MEFQLHRYGYISCIGAQFLGYALGRHVLITESPIHYKQFRYSTAEFLSLFGVEDIQIRRIQFHSQVLPFHRTAPAAAWFYHCVSIILSWFCLR